MTQWESYDIVLTSAVKKDCVSEVGCICFVLAVTIEILEQ